MRVIYAVLFLGILLPALAILCYPIDSADATIACYQCHGTISPTDYRPLDAAYRNPSTGGFQGNHRTHMGADATPSTCSKCHPGSGGYTSRHSRDSNNKIKVSSRINSSPLTTRYNNSTSAFPQTVTPTLAVCTNVNCHFETTSPSWGDDPAATSCSTCHGAPPVGTSGNSYSGGAAGSHPKHDISYSGASNCIKCHSDHTADPKPFAHATSAGKRGLLVQPRNPSNSVSGTYSPPFIPISTILPSQAESHRSKFGNCSTTYCHSNGTSIVTGIVPANISPVWGSGSLACNACHGNNTYSDSRKGLPLYTSGSPKVNSHSGHVMGCGYCHYNTTNDGATIADTSLHVNKAYNLARNPSKPVFFNYSFASGGGRCAAITCHGNANAAWGGTVSCGSCHVANKNSLNSGSHKTHLLSAWGPNGDTETTTCDTCHGAGATTGRHPGHGDGIKAFTDGNTLAGTSVCNDCHSPGGDYDGVNDATIGAKPNWAQRIYTSVSGTLEAKTGKEKWCAGCHDKAPSVISGVAAPNVVGDETGATPYGAGYGFYKTGHGLPNSQINPWTRKTGSPQQKYGANLTCTNYCHDPSARHTDGQARTYRSYSGAPGTPATYKAGYRLQLSPQVPRKYNAGDTDVKATDFTGCLWCHAGGTSPFIVSNNRFSNFRDDVDSPSHNDHYTHLAIRDTEGYGPVWQSDWRAPIGGHGDSRSQCVQCHNVHGSTRLAMVNDGKLTGKEPGIRLMYTNNPPNVPSDMTLPDSTATGWIADDFGPAKANSTCTSTCHGGAPDTYAFYRRLPNDTEAPAIEAAYGQLGGTYLTVVFSEGVYKNNNGTGSLTTQSFNVGGLIGVEHAPGDDIALLQLGSPLSPGGEVQGQSGFIYDLAGNNVDFTPHNISTTDGSLPVASGMNPPHNSSNVSVSANLAFVLSDSASGVNWNSVSIQLTGDKGYSRSYGPASPAVAKSGNPRSYSVTVNPDADFADQELITVTIQINDIVGNAMTPPAWSFSTTNLPVPVAPSIGNGTGLSATSIRWGFTDNASDETGFKLHDSSHNLKASQVSPDLTWLDETGLSANTQYTRHVHAYNGFGDSVDSLNATKATLGNIPTGATASDGTYADRIRVAWSSGGVQSGYRVFRDGDKDSGVQVYDGTLTVFFDIITGSHTYYVYSKNMDGALSAGYASDTGNTSAGGLYTATLHPTGLSSSSADWHVSPGGSSWAAVLATNDGHGTYAYNDPYEQPEDPYGYGGVYDDFWVEMENLPSCTNIQSITISAYISTIGGFGMYGPIPYGSPVTFTIGADTAWDQSNLTVPANTSGYTLLKSADITRNNGFNPLTCADINNMKVHVLRPLASPPTSRWDRVTEVSVEVTYSP